MCSRAKMKVRLMTIATVILIISTVSVVISSFMPFWVHVEIDGRNISNNATTYMYYHHDQDDESFTDDEYDDDETTDTSVNLTNYILEHRANRSFAIWYISTCIDGTCYTDLYPDEINGTYSIQSYYEPGYNFSWVDSRIPFSRQKKFQIYVSIAIVVSFVAVILTCDQKRKYRRETTGDFSAGCHSVLVMTTLGLILAAGVLVWVPSLAYGNVNNQLFALEDREIFDSVDNKPVTIYTPVALIFTAISLISFALVFISIFVAYLLKRFENQEHRSVSLALIPLHSRGARQSEPIPSAVYQSERGFSRFAQADDIFARQIPFANTVHVSHQAAGNNSIAEAPPPSYEETMRLYEAKEASNIYLRKNTNDS